MSSQKSLDLNFITLRKIYAYNHITNAKITPTYVLTMTSTGEAIWAPPASSGSGPTGGHCYSDYLYWDTNTSQWTPGGNKVHIGCDAGYSNQDSSSVAIGNSAGYSDQGERSVAIGPYAGYSNQGYSAVAIGDSAGFLDQSNNAVAIGAYAGKTSQGESSVAIGINAGNENQDSSSVAIGPHAGYSNQRYRAIAIGASAGETDQSSNAIAIGTNAGNTSQGESSVAIGSYAGMPTQTANSIALNASGTALDAPIPGFFVNPIRPVIINSDPILFYRTGTHEVIYDSATNLNLDSNGNLHVNGHVRSLMPIKVLPPFTNVTSDDIGYYIYVNFYIPFFMFTLPTTPANGSTISFINRSGGDININTFPLIANNTTTTFVYFNGGWISI